MKGAISLAIALALTTADSARASGIGPFIIFFDPGSARITQGAAPILDNAAAALAYDDRESASSAGVFLIAGQGDTAGSAIGNRRLSCARAQAVRAYLVRKGIVAQRLFPVGYGEDRPLVRTGDGVVEPQNRYVEISITVADQVAQLSVGATRC